MHRMVAFCSQPWACVPLCFTWPFSSVFLATKTQIIYSNSAVSVHTQNRNWIRTMIFSKGLAQISRNRFSRCRWLFSLRPIPQLHQSNHIHDPPKVKLISFWFWTCSFISYCWFVFLAPTGERVFWTSWVFGFLPIN